MNYAIKEKIKFVTNEPGSDPHFIFTYAVRGLTEVTAFRNPQPQVTQEEVFRYRRSAVENFKRRYPHHEFAVVS